MLLLYMFVDSVPPPACNDDNVGEYQPTESCSDLYYICTSATGVPVFQVYFFS